MVEIESYSDRLKPPASSGPSRLDPNVLHLDESLFPPVLWKEYFEGQAGGTKKEKARKRRKLDDGDNEEDEMVRPISFGLVMHRSKGLTVVI
jgi:DNA-directed RNA polymerase III subunit RPC7